VLFPSSWELTETLSRLNTHFFATKNYMSRIPGRAQFSYDPHRRSSRACLKRGNGHGGRAGRGDRAAAQAEPPRGRDLSFQEMTKEIAAAAKEVFDPSLQANSVLVGSSWPSSGICREIGSGPPEPGKEDYLRKGFEFAREWS